MLLPALVWPAFPFAPPLVAPLALCGRVHENFGHFCDEFAAACPFLLLPLLLLSHLILPAPPRGAPIGALPPPALLLCARAALALAALPFAVDGRAGGLGDSCRKESLRVVVGDCMLCFA